MNIDGDLDSGIVVRFFMARPERIRKIMSTHRPALDGPWCESHNEHWPCFVRRCAEMAQVRLYTPNQTIVEPP